MQVVRTQQVSLDRRRGSGEEQWGKSSGSENRWNRSWRNEMGGRKVGIGRRAEGREEREQCGKWWKSIV